jgi:carboxyl-terminal processing protease|tara:strand:- start:84 stop:1406 length:1323 start_codon:yes stop_codon:yes gene_type:complete
MDATILTKLSRLLVGGFILLTAPAVLSAPEEEELPARLPLDELRIFVEAFDRVSSAYVEEIDDKTLLENAIKGMLAGLDPHSAYLDQDSFSDLQENTTGNYGGLGLEVGMEDGFIKVIAPMDGTPAAEAGIEAGDLIIQLDDKPVKGMTLTEAIEVMRGLPGSPVDLTIIREAEAMPLELTLVREVIQVSSVRHRILEDGFGYIRIAQFQNNSSQDVGRSIEALTEEQELRGLVLDLRNNPGGVLQAAVEVTDLFVDEGLIVYTDGRLPTADLRFSATSNDRTDGVPIIVLVNAGTASASEIVAGALQDHQRAIIMGTNTFGKGSVQTILPLNESKAIKLTTALYYTPNGRSIQAEGIVPDIWVERSTVTLARSSSLRVKEKDLRKHLPNVDEDEAAAAGESEEEVEIVSNSDLISRDYQLNEALTVLKGLNIMASKTEP